MSYISPGEMKKLFCARCGKRMKFEPTGTMSAVFLADLFCPFCGDRRLMEESFISM